MKLPVGKNSASARVNVWKDQKWIPLNSLTSEEQQLVKKRISDAWREGTMSEYRRQVNLYLSRPEREHGNHEQ